jgi:hypothetical protein
LRLLDDCDDVLMPLCDGADGDYDGQSAILNDVFTTIAATCQHQI